MLIAAIEIDDNEKVIVMRAFNHGALVTVVCGLSLSAHPEAVVADELSLANDARGAMRRAATFFVNEVASNGGYVYFYSLDLKQRWGEGVASKNQIWVQPPGTPTVGLAFIRAFEATQEPEFRVAAAASARALAYGQLRSGGWTNCIDFDPRGTRTADYRNGKGRGKDNSSLDDGQTQSALLLMIRADETLEFKDATIHESAELGLKALLQAQFPNGAFPQVWTGPVPRPPVRKASYPDYDWRSEGRIKEYWTMYTLNDNVCGYVTDTLLEAHRIYGDDRYKQALRKLGDFLILAQMPEPQPGWAQQYSYDMHPIWARRFEPPGISGDETQEVIETLLRIASATDDDRYLKPIPSALAYLKRSLLDDGRLARYYELKTNRPLYMVRNGKNYRLTYDDSNLPAHYGWKSESRIEQLESAYQRLMAGNPIQAESRPAANQVRRVIDRLDAQGRWVSTYDGQRLVGQAKMRIGDRYLSSEVFSTNLTQLADYVEATRGK